jgi:hypothetical protein
MACMGCSGTILFPYQYTGKSTLIIFITMGRCEDTHMVNSGDIPLKLLQLVNRYNKRRRGSKRRK